jgi:hypothetical protein
MCQTDLNKIHVGYTFLEHHIGLVATPQVACLIECGTKA